MINRITLAILLCLIGTACATPRYTWKPAPEKTPKQAYDDLIRCQRASFIVPAGYYGNGADKFVTRCMYSEGHSLEELKD